MSIFILSLDISKLAKKIRTKRKVKWRKLNQSTKWKFSIFFKKNKKKRNKPGIYITILECRLVNKVFFSSKSLGNFSSLSRLNEAMPRILRFRLYGKNTFLIKTSSQWNVLRCGFCFWMLFSFKPITATASSHFYLVTCFSLNGENAIAQPNDHVS